MSNNISRGRSVAIWCMSMLTLGAWSIVSNNAMTLSDAKLLAAICVVPPLFMLLVWGRASAPVAVPLIAR